jgi:hypothetical protein
MTNEEKIALILEWESPKKDFVPISANEYDGNRGTFWARVRLSSNAYGPGVLAVSNTGTNGAAFHDDYHVGVYPTELRLLSTERVISEVYPTVQTFPLIVDRDEFLAAARMCITLIN